MIGCVLRTTRVTGKNRLSAGESTWSVVSSDGDAVVKRAGEAFSQPPLSPALVQHLLYNPRQA
jgi:hypothetical protein